MSPKPIYDTESTSRPRRSEPKRGPLDGRVEYRLSDGNGRYWTGSHFDWPKKGKPIFNKLGGKWSSESRALQLWAEYNLARAVQGADWPDLVLEKFKIVINKAPNPSTKPIDLSKLVAWHSRFSKHHPLLAEAERLVKRGVNFKYLLEYRGDGMELPSHLKAHIHIVRNPTFGSDRDNFITAAFCDDKDMIFARVALGDRVKHIINDEAVTVYEAEGER